MIDAKQILEQVRQNQRKLESCAGPHDFTQPARKIGEWVTDWFCAKCGGKIDNINKLWYERGMKHAQATPSTTTQQTVRTSG